MAEVALSAAIETYASQHFTWIFRFIAAMNFPKDPGAAVGAGWYVVRTERSPSAQSIPPA